MIKTEAAKLTAKQLRGGHFVTGMTTAYVYCPQCRARVNIEHHAWEKPTPALRKALTEHLMEFCETHSGCTQTAREGR